MIEWGSKTRGLVGGDAMLAIKGAALSSLQAGWTLRGVFVFSALNLVIPDGYKQGGVVL